MVATAGTSRAPALRPRGRVDAPRRDDRHRVLPSQSSEHEHGQADPRDVGRGVPESQNRPGALTCRAAPPLARCSSATRPLSSKRQSNRHLSCDPRARAVIPQSVQPAARPTGNRRHVMNRWLLAAVLLAGAACDTRREAVAPLRNVDPAPTATLATTAATARVVVIVNYDETATTSDAMSAAIMNVGSGVIQFNNLDLVAALATPAEIGAIAALPAVQGVYANKALGYSAMLHESVAT